MGFTNWQERAEKAEDALRSLASFVGAGGYNADTVDADVFEEKIRWGIGQIMERLEKAESELEAERKRLDWALKKQGYYARNPDRLWVDVGTGNHKWFAVNDDNPRATIDELIAGEQK